MTAEMSGREIALKIDGKEVRAREGMTLLEVARKAGVDIPTLCYHPALSPFGVCRMCLVEVADKGGRKRVVVSCTYPVEEGLVVDTRSEQVMKARKMILEFLLARCPKERRIQELAREYGIERPSLWVEDEDERCILCGLCARACEELVGVSAINFARRGVDREITTPYHALSDVCIGCGVCATICPTEAIREKRGIYPISEEEAREIESRFLKGERDELLGVYSSMLAGKSSIEGQDGGMVTALLVSGMKRGLFDAALVVGREEGYRAKAFLAESVDEVVKASGTKYVRVKIVPILEEAVERGIKRIAVVGTPCEVRAVRKIQKIWEREKPEVDITLLGLFCFESFIYERLKKKTEELLGVSLDQAEKTQISKGKYRVRVGGTEYSCSVKKLGEALEKGCPFCDDFVAKFADLSVGSVGSPDGYSTVIVRSEKGKKLLEGVTFEKGEVNREEIIKVATQKKDNAKKNFDPILQGLLSRAL